MTHTLYPRKTTRKNHRFGYTLTMGLILIIALTAMASLAVDFGRVQLAKSALRDAADAASRHAASNLINGISATLNAAIDAADDNKVDGQALLLNRNEDIELGLWNTSTKTFTKLSGSQRSNANAVRVIARRTEARGNAIPTVFAAIVGKRSQDITVESISMRVAPVTTTYDIPATASPYLAGMPNGTMSSPNNPHNSPDYAPYQSPVQVMLPVKPGTQFTFNTISGGANNDKQWTDRYQPDGNLSWITSNDTAQAGGELGKSDMKAPINALVGVFLTDNDPRYSGNLPEKLDFETEASRNFSNLAPKIAQVFFIGDGLKSDGTSQTFTVPANATRFYLANWDGYEWNNNVGMRTTAVTRQGRVVTVR
jgi:Flp pilus assembly protein TadG